MMPPIDVPWPPRNLVAECTTISAPCSIGRHRYGDAMVLSMTSGTPASCAICGDRFDIEHVHARVGDGLAVERAWSWA